MQELVLKGRVGSWGLGSQQGCRAEHPLASSALVEEVEDLMHSECW